MKQISKVELVEKFSEEMKKGRKIAVDVTSTINKDMKKTGNPYLENVVTKSVSLSGCAGGDYENMVNAQLDREGKEQTFMSQGRTWGVHVNEYFIEHKGNYYLEMKVEGSSTPVYRVDGVEIETSKIEPFLPKKGEPKTQAAADKKIILRDIKVDNIKSIRFNTEEFVIV